MIIGRILLILTASVATFFFQGAKTAAAQIDNRPHVGIVVIELDGGYQYLAARRFRSYDNCNTGMLVLGQDMVFAIGDDARGY